MTVPSTIASRPQLTGAQALVLHELVVGGPVDTCHPRAGHDLWSERLKGHGPLMPPWLSETLTFLDDVDLIHRNKNGSACYGIAATPGAKLTDTERELAEQFASQQSLRFGYVTVTQWQTEADNDKAERRLDLEMADDLSANDTAVASDDTVTSEVTAVTAVTTTESTDQPTETPRPGQLSNVPPSILDLATANAFLRRYERTIASLKKLVAERDAHIADLTVGEELYEEAMGLLEKAEARAEMAEANAASAATRATAAETLAAIAERRAETAEARATTAAAKAASYDKQLDIAVGLSADLDTRLDATLKENAQLKADLANATAELAEANRRLAAVRKAAG